MLMLRVTYYLNMRNKENRAHYVNWVEQKWGVVVDKTTITRILKTKEKRLSTEIIHPKQKRHKSVTYPELELALNVKEFVLNYQHRTILSDAILIEKAKLLAEGLEISGLQFSNGWLQGFKKRNGIRQHKLQGEAASANQAAILEALPILHEKCANYPPERIYNMDETGLFYRYIFLLFVLLIIIVLLNTFCRLEPDRTLATRRLSGRKKNKERLSVALCSNADGSHRINYLQLANGIPK